MKCREFTYIGGSVPQLTEQEHTAFYLQFQKSIFASLKQRGLLTGLQYQRCVEELEMQYAKIKKGQA